MGNMRILIITQKVDINDDVLGFFHNWLEKFAQKFEKIIVICLQKGECNLPKNVEVLSLGKEKNMSKTKYLVNFYKYIWRKRKEYDAVFIHMNQEYVILAGLFWRFLGKKIFLWRNHIKGNFLTKIAVKLSKKVFYTSQFAYTAKFKNSKIMPVGIDMERFSAQGGSASGGKIQGSILSLGRIDPVKNIHILVDALKLVGRNLVVDIYGKGTGEYYSDVKKEAGDLAVFRGNIQNYKTPEIYNKHEIFVNLTPGGSFDKTIVEAMACGCLPIVCNESLRGVLDNNFFLFKDGDAKDLAEKIERVLNLPDSEKENYRKKFRDYAEKNHSLDKLIKKIINMMNN